jgi:adenylate kinase
MKDLFRQARLSTSDMLLDAALGQQAKAVKLTGDKLVAEIVAEAIARSKCRRGFMLHGSPRTAAQAEPLDAMLLRRHAAIGCMIRLDVDDEMLVERIAGRSAHPPSGRSYSIFFNSSKRDGLGDIAGKPVIKRQDDIPDKLRAR